MKSLGERAITVRVDWYTRVCLTAIAVLLTVVIAGLWADGVQLAPTARADDKIMFDSAGDRKAMIAEQQSTNAKLDEVIKVLRSGEGKVQVVDAASPDKKGQGARGRDDK